MEAAMAVTRLKKERPAGPTSLEEFVNGAPDSGAASDAKLPGFKQGNRQQFTHTMSPELLTEVEARRKELGLSRAVFINMAVASMLRNGAIIDGDKTS
jgi:hypothetical protein